MASTMAVLTSEVVGPAISAVLKDDELGDAELTLRSSDDGNQVQMFLTVRGERFEDLIYDASMDYPLSGWRDRLTSNLQDFVAESKFGWGQKR